MIKFQILVHKLNEAEWSKETRNTGAYDVFSYATTQSCNRLFLKQTRCISLHDGRRVAP